MDQNLLISPQVAINRDMEQADFYKTLGVSPKASIDTIKKTYRRLAIQYHPDKNPEKPNAHERFQEISEAYSVLSNPAKRAEYDRQRKRDRTRHAQQEASSSSQSRPERQKGGHRRGFFHRPPPPKRARPRTRASNSRQGGGFGKFIGDILSGDPAQRHRSGLSTRGADLHRELQLTLQEVAEGGRKIVHVTYEQTCNRCGGSRAEPDAKRYRCPWCKGSGAIKIKSGDSVNKTRCAHCRGSGDVVSRTCFGCHGTGTTTRERRVAIFLEPGLKEGTKIKVSRQGEPGQNGGPAGDLYLTISFQPHQHFVREGNDLYCEAKVEFTQAILGHTINIPTLNGRVALKIPPGTQPNSLLCVRRKGLPGSRGEDIGDMYVRLKVAFPSEITPYQRRLLELFQQDSEIS